MDPISFTYWLQGFFEISDAKKLDEKQVQVIKDHLNLVFNKVTPNRKFKMPNFPQVIQYLKGLKTLILCLNLVVWFALA